MYLASVNFGKNRLRQDTWDLENAAEEYLVALRRNGQLCGKYVLGWVRGSLNAYVHLPRPNAFDKRFCSEWAKDRLTKASNAFNAAPVWSVLEDNIPKRFQSWKSAPALYLHTAWSVHEPPVQRRDNDKPIPTYLLPLSDMEKDEVYSWAYSYRNHDLIWTESGTLEIPAYRQLVDPQSELSQWGRHICRIVEKATGVPTYYYLYRYWGRRGEDTTRLCPSCGKEWRVKDNPKSSKPFWDLLFQCKKCRLVSHEACTDDDARHARIGEYRLKK